MKLSHCDICGKALPKEKKVKKYTMKLWLDDGPFFEGEIGEWELCEDCVLAADLLDKLEMAIKGRRK